MEGKHDVVAGAIRGLTRAEARMNEDGRHWTKRHFKWMLDPLEGEEGEDEFAYCLIGGVAQEMLGYHVPGNGFGALRTAEYKLAVKALVVAIFGGGHLSDWAVAKYGVDAAFAHARRVENMNADQQEWLIEAWNDEPRRKWGGVVRAMRKAVRLLEDGLVKP